MTKTAAKTPKPAKLTEAELETLADALKKAWDRIAYDLLELQPRQSMRASDALDACWDYMEGEEAWKLSSRRSKADEKRIKKMVFGDYQYVGM